MSGAKRWSFLLLIVVAVYGITAAGDLEPPGPPAPTGRSTIFQVNMPFTISTPGSYVVMENLTAGASEHGISITASTNDVTLDLNGFTLKGVPGSLIGIRVNGSTHNIAIVNGVVRDWGQDGISAIFGFNTQIRNIRAYNNGHDFPDGAGGSGILSGTNSTIQNCTSLANNDHGIVSRFGSVISASTARDNYSDGIQGIESLVIGCAAMCNNQSGIHDDIALPNNGTGVNNHTGPCLP